VVAIHYLRSEVRDFEYGMERRFIVNVGSCFLRLLRRLRLFARPVEWLYWKAMIRTFRPIPVKKIKLVIFDLDGTLIDSELDLAASVNAMLRHYGRNELPLKVIDTYIGDGAPMLIRRALGDPSDREFLQEALTISSPTTATTSWTTPTRTTELRRRCSRSAPSASRASWRC